MGIDDAMIKEINDRYDEQTVKINDKPTIDDLKKLRDYLKDTFPKEENTLEEDKAKGK